MKLLFAFLLTATLACAAEPKRAAGLSVHMLPERVAKIGGGHGGFTVDTSAGERTYGEAKELFAFFQHLPATTQENGIWIVTTDPTSYAPAEHAKLKALIGLCTAGSVPIYTCRGSELPNGWKRAE